MNIRHVFYGLTAVNSGLLVMLSAQLLPVNAKDNSGVLRGTALEIVDVSGKPRATIGIIPSGTTGSGEAYPETVLLRLIDDAGQPSVKLSATGKSAGLSFVGGDDASFVQLMADGPRGTLRIVEPNGTRSF